MSICLIPARGGSKRIPRKNIRNFCGKPMIHWSIEVAKKAGCFKRIIVSTDDTEVAEVAKAAGAEVPFMRPSALANDHATTMDVARHAVEWLGTDAPKTLCCLYATAPFAQAGDILAGKKLLAGADFVVPVTSFAYPVQRALRLSPEGRLAMLYPEHAQTRSQDLQEVYHDVGQFYWGKSNAWRASAAIFGGDTLPIILPRWRVQDIDTPEDWARAEAMFVALELK